MLVLAADVCEALSVAIDLTGLVTAVGYLLTPLQIVDSETVEREET